MTVSVRWRVLAGFGTALLLLAIVGSVAYRSSLVTTAGVAEVRAAGDEMIGYQQLLALVEQERAAVRGFVIVGSDAILAPHDSALAQLPSVLRDLRRLAGADSVEQRGLDSIQTLIATRASLAAEIIRTRRVAGAAAASSLLITGPGTQLGDLLRRLIGGMVAVQHAERDRRIAALQEHAKSTRGIVLAGWLIAILAVGVATMLVFRGLASRERAEAHVRELADDLQDLYDHAPVGYHSLDAHGIFVRMNQTELGWLGYARDEIVGRMHFTDLLAPASREGFELNFERFRATGEVRDQAYSLFRKNGTILPVLLSASAVRDADGRFVMSRGVSMDVTERRRMEVEVQTLSGLLPICASCKKIRDDRGYWNQIESYISRHSRAEFSHGLCPECLQRLYPELAAEPGP
jgi:PAS domain S-box-containing protein